MNFLSRHLRTFLSAFQRGREKVRGISISLYLVGLFVAMWAGNDGLVALCLILLLDEYYSIQFAVLRREIRAKRMWNDGQ